MDKKLREKCLLNDREIFSVVFDKEPIDDEWVSSCLPLYKDKIAEAQLDKAESLIRQDERERVFRELPWKRTIIGNERSMPDKTVIWFITGEECEALKATVEGK